MAECKISLAENGKFLVETKADVWMLGWEAKKGHKYSAYYMEIAWANLIDLFHNKNMLGITDIIYDDPVIPIIDMLREECKVIKAAHRFKVMPIDEIHAIWNLEGFNELLPKLAKIFDHQKRAVLWNLEVRKGGVFAEQGLGKTIIGSIILKYLLVNKLIKKPLLISPVTLINEKNWLGALPKFADLKPINLRNDDEFYDEKGDVFIVNPEKFASWCFQKTKDAEKSYNKDNYFECQKFDAVIFDESDYLKTAGSLTTQAFLNFSRHAKYISLMSGTPSPNEIFQIWGQMKVLGSILGDSHGAFEKRYGILKNVGPIQKYFPRQTAEMEIRKRIDDVSYFIPVKGNIELPEEHIETVQVTLTEEHMKVYKQIEEEYFCAIEGKTIEGDLIEGKAIAKHEIVVRMKLLQILNGFSGVVDEDDVKHVIELPWNPKVDKLDKVIEEKLQDKDSNIIIWCRFRWEIENLTRRYKDKYNATYVYGGMTDKKRNANLDKWLDDPTCRIIICHPKSVKYGHTWLKANYRFYLSGTEDFGDYSQSSKRNMRIGQDREVWELRFIAENTIEPMVWKSIARRMKLDKYMKTYAKLTKAG